MERPVHLIIRRTLNSENAIVDGYFHFRADLAGKLTFRAFDFHQIVLADRNGYASGNLNRCSTNS